MSRALASAGADVRPHHGDCRGAKREEQRNERVIEARGESVARDRIGPEVEPDDPERAIDEPRLDRLRAYVAGVLPGLGNHIVEAVSCRYTMTPDEDFVIGQHPAHAQFVIASPCSGHGFKFAPVIGRIVADLAVRGTTAHDISRFRLDRPALQKV